VSQSPLRIGTSGWSYPTGRGTWTGVFYPAADAGPAQRSRRTRGGVDELAYYAERFDTVEINSSFYGVPKPEVTRGWARRTPAGFEFAAKLWQKFTHPAMFAKAAHEEAPARPVVTRTDVDEVRRAFDPLASAGKLGPLLAQFPPSFHADEAALDYLEWLVDAFAGFQIAVELRHRSWSDDPGRTLGILNRHAAAWAQIDEPKFRSSIRQDLLPNVTSFYYLRLHGRNAAQWWDHEATEDRYNYLYSAGELEPFVGAATLARRLVRKLYLYMNNHFEAKSVANAVMLKHRLGEPITGTYPESFLEKYPDLRGIAPSVLEPPPAAGGPAAGAVDQPGRAAEPRERSSSPAGQGDLFG
jgi:uncharacterized protein YecE (DUF72 family)